MYLKSIEAVIEVMLDSGSEANIIKVCCIPDKKYINQQSTCILKGIDNEFKDTLGKVKLRMCGKEVEFLVVPDSIPFPYHAVLGANFFIQNNVSLDFGNLNLQVGEDNYKIYQNKRIVTRVDPESSIINLQHVNSQPKLPFLKIYNPPTETEEKLLIDTGSESNIISKYLLPPTEKINESERYFLKGIGSRVIPTLGTVEILIHKKPIRFHVVDSSINLPGAGILGAECFTSSGSKINFADNTITIGDQTLKMIFYDTNTANNNNSSPEHIQVNCNVSDDEDEDHATEMEPCFWFDENQEERSNFAQSHLEYLSCLETMSDLDINIEYKDEVYTSSFNFLANFANTSTTTTKIYNIETSEILELIKTDYLNKLEADYVKNLVTKNRDIFFLPGDDLPGTDLVNHKIPTSDDEPINVKQYKYPHSFKVEANKQVEDLLKKKIIRHSNSPYNFPLWIVPKKPDSQGNPRMRMVIDYRKLNMRTIGDAYPLPNIEEIFDQVGGAKYYTVLDLASGFHQIKMDPKDAAKTAFSTPFGHYEFARMPFGLKNAPATFQRLMDKLFIGLQGIILFVYLDDIVVYANSIEEHDKKIKILFSRLREAGLKLQIDKCLFLKRKVNYLGHVLSDKGLQPDPAKIEAVKGFPVPKTVKNVRQFLGLAGYYRRFIKDFAKIAKPLTKLLQKDQDFDWNEKSQLAFEDLKQMLCKAPILQFPNVLKPYNVTTDASGYAVGGVLSQGEIGKDLPIAYTSRVLRGPELKYEVYEKEALAVIHSVKTFRSYLYGTKFTVLTDHQPLVWFKTADLNTRVQKWKFKLSEYEYEIVYKPGRLNSNADALSRNPIEPIPINVVTRAKKLLNDVENTKPIRIINDDNENSEIIQKPKRGRPKKKIPPDPPPDPPNPILPKRRGRPPKSKVATPINSDIDTDTDDSIDEENDYINMHRSDTSVKSDNARTINFPDLTQKSEISREQSHTNSDEITNYTPSLVTSARSRHTSAEFKLIEIKEHLRHKKDNIVYFVDSNGTPCDEGAVHLIENDKPNLNLPMDVNSIQIIKRRNKCTYVACVRGESQESLSIIKENLNQLFKTLLMLLNKFNQNLVHIAKSKTIENLDWQTVSELIKNNFFDQPIKIIICTGTLKYLPEEERDAIFKELHNSPIGGHRGVSKTYNRIKRDYYWENLKEDIQRRIQQCLDCQLKKLVRLKTKQPMIITDTPGTVFDKIAMDIVGPLKITNNGNEYILTMQDQLSKFCLAIPLSNTLSSTIADAFVKRWICIFGAPKCILTDQGRNFLSSLIGRVAKRFKIKRVKTTAFHPQSNGSLERSHHCLGEYLKQYTTKDENWDEWLDVAMLNYNTCIQESTKHTPYEVVFGKLARLPSNTPLREGDMLPTYKGYVIDLVTRLTGIQKLAYENLLKSKHRSKKYYDQKLNPKVFKPGDYVYLLSGPKPGKFGDHYTGPHRILEILPKYHVKILFHNKPKIVNSNRLRISFIHNETNNRKNKKLTLRDVRPRD